MRCGMFEAFEALSNLLKAKKPDELKTKK